MIVNGLTFLGGGPAIGGPISPLQLQQTSAGSAFGPAYLLASSAEPSDPGIYSSLSPLAAAAESKLAAGSAQSDVIDRQRRQALESAKSKISAGNTAGARADAQGLLSRNASDATALHLVAHSYLLEQDYEQAERYYIRASAAAPDNARLKSDLGAARVLQKGDAEALAAGRGKLKDPGTRSEGLRLLSYLGERSPDSAEVYLALADGFSAERQPVKVLGALQEALRYADDRQLGEVISRARAVVEDYPEVGLPHNLLGRALQKAGRLDDAVDELGAAARAAPGNFAYTEDLADAYAARAVERIASGDAINAAVDLHEAAAIDPSNPRVDEGAARLAAYRAEREIAGGRHGRALGELRTASAKTPDDTTFKRRVAGLFIRVAQHFKGDNDDAQALSAYRKAFALDPASSVAQKNVAELSYTEGLAALSGKDYNAAISHLERARQTDGSKSEYRTNLADAYDQRGQLHLAWSELDDAIRDFSRGFSLDPSNTSAASDLAAARAQKYGS